IASRARVYRDIWLRTCCPAWHWLLPWSCTNDRDLCAHQRSMQLPDRFGRNGNAPLGISSTPSSVGQAAINQDGEARSFQGRAASRRERSFVSFINLASATGSVTANPALRANAIIASFARKTSPTAKSPGPGCDNSDQQRNEPFAAPGLGHRHREFA